MPSKAQSDSFQGLNTPKITGRCYCGAVSLRFSTPPQMVTYCHCVDCRRWTGAPVGVFAAFARDAIIAHPALNKGKVHTTGVERWNCTACGSPLAATFDYLPEQIYVPIGLLDQANDLPPSLHCHADSRLVWLPIRDDLPRQSGTGRDMLTDTANKT